MKLQAKYYGLFRDITPLYLVSEVREYRAGWNEIDVHGVYAESVTLNGKARLRSVNNAFRVPADVLEENEARKAEEHAIVRVAIKVSNRIAGTLPMRRLLLPGIFPVIRKNGRETLMMYREAAARAPGHSKKHRILSTAAALVAIGIKASKIPEIVAALPPMAMYSWRPVKATVVDPYTMTESVTVLPDTPKCLHSTGIAVVKTRNKQYIVRCIKGAGKPVVLGNLSKYLVVKYPVSTTSAYMLIKPSSGGV